MMNNAGKDFYCSGFDEWISKIRRIKNMSAEERETLVKINLNYVRHNYSDEALDSVWMHVFEEVAR